MLGGGGAAATGGPGPLLLPDDEATATLTRLIPAPEPVSERGTAPRDAVAHEDVTLETSGVVGVGVGLSGMNTLERMEEATQRVFETMVAEILGGQGAGGGQARAGDGGGQGDVTGRGVESGVEGEGGRVRVEREGPMTTTRRIAGAGGGIEVKEKGDKKESERPTHEQQQQQLRSEGVGAQARPPREGQVMLGLGGL